VDERLQEAVAVAEDHADGKVGVMNDDYTSRPTTTRIPDPL
jgi:hypothetical protein